MRRRTVHNVKYSTVRSLHDRGFSFFKTAVAATICISAYWRRNYRNPSSRSRSMLEGWALDQTRFWWRYSVDDIHIIADSASIPSKWLDAVENLTDFQCCVVVQYRDNSSESGLLDYTPNYWRPKVDLIHRICAPQDVSFAAPRDGPSEESRFYLRILQGDML
jgi:hypothetical protein